MSTINSANVQVGQSNTPANNITLSTSAGGDLVVSKGSSGALTEITRITNAGLIDASKVSFTPAGGIAATNVQAAIAEVGTDLSSSSGSSLIGYLPSGTGAVATTVQQQLRNMQAWNLLAKDAPYYAMGLGTGDDTAAINAALTAAWLSTYKKTVLVPAGEYILTAPLVVPVGVSLIGEGRGFINTSYGYLSGTVFRKNHNGNAISVTGSGGNNDIAGMLQGFCVVSNAATYATGAGVFIDGVQQAIVRDVTVSRCGGDSFVFGSTATANFTTYVTATNCYANTAGTGKAFAVNSKWARLKQCISDGGAYGFYLGAAAQEGLYEDIHCELVTNTGIYLTGAGRNKFVKPYVNITSAGSYGIYCANVSGTYYNRFDEAHILASNTAGQVAFYNVGNQNIFNKLVSSTIETFDTGYQDTGSYNSALGNSFYNVKFPMVMNAAFSTLKENTTQNTVSAGGTWAINHVGGTTGNWTDNNLDGSNANGLINPGATGVIGNFSGIRARNNAGFVSRNGGQTASITTGSTVSHGLAGSPASGGVVFVSPFTSGITNTPNINGITSTVFAINWTGTVNCQFQWVANLACDF